MNMSRINFKYWWILSILFAPLSIYSSDINPSIEDNYIKHTIITSACEKGSMTSIDYFDGFGRKIQTKLVEKSSNGDDLLFNFEYDYKNRLLREYLPINTSESAVYENMASIKSNYNSIYGTASENACIDYFYKTGNVNPENQLYLSKKPGEAWKQNKGIEYDYYLVNNPGKYAYINSTGSLILSSTFYSEGEIRCKTEIDEDSITIKTFFDRFNRIIRIRRGETNTDYVYDIQNNLRYIFSPLATEEMMSLNEGVINKNASFLGTLSYIYEYDEHNRLIRKKLPGADWIYMIYDENDLIRYTQDGNQRLKSEWTAYAYDKFHRLTMTASVEKIGITEESIRDLTKTINMKSEFKGNTSSSVFGYEKITDGITADNVEQIYYYDTYDFLDIFEQQKPELLYSDTEISENGAYPKINNPKGFRTGGAVRIIGTDIILPNALYYDHAGNLITKIEQNYLDGYEKEYYTLSIDGTLLAKKSLYATSDITIVDSFNYEYDNGLRLSKIFFSRNGQPQSRQVHNIYDNLGRISSTVYGNNAVKQNYKYNIHGNLIYLEGCKFSQDIYYEKDFYNNPTYLNGNISAIEWGDVETAHRYTFTYNKLNQLTEAKYKIIAESIDGLEVRKNKTDYSCSYNYDINGNPIKVNAKGMIGEALTESNLINSKFGDMKNINYNRYGNQIRNVSFRMDANTMSITNYSKELFDGRSDHYQYDASGNMIYDGIREMSTTYNRFNLPEEINIKDFKKTSVYDGSGKKRLSTYFFYTLGTIKKRMEYGNHIYFINEENTLCSFMPWGVIENGENYYFIKDYQGSIREVVDEKGKSFQINHFYPYGSLSAETDWENFSFLNLFCGKELFPLFYVNQYDFEARWYDPVMIGFNTMDSHAENTPHISPYAYCASNPVRYVDPTGKDIWDINPWGKVTNHVKTDLMDQFRLVDYDNVQRKDAAGNDLTIEFDYNTVEKTWNRKDRGYDMDFYQIRGDDNAQALFEFLSNNISCDPTNVEFSWVQTGDIGNNGLNFVNTGHSRGSEPGLSYLYTDVLQCGYHIRSITHSHPVDINFGKEDLSFKETVVDTQRSNKLHIPEFYIYHVPTKQYLKK